MKKTLTPDRAKGKVKNLRPMLHYLRPYKWEALAAFITMTFTAIAVLAMGQGLKHLIDEGLSKGDSYLLDQSFFILAGVVLLLSVASYGRFYLVTWIGERVVSDIRRDVFSHLTRMHIGFYETTRIGELLSRLTTDTTLIQTVIGSSLSVAVRNGLMLIGGMGLMILTSVHLSAYLFLALPVVVGPIIILGRKLRIYARSAQERVADISAQAEESFNAIRTIQSYTLERQQDDIFESRLQALLKASHQRIRMRSMLTAIVILLVFGSIVTVLWFGGRDVLEGRITAGSLSSFVFYSIVVAGAVGALSEVMADIQRAAGAAERLGELLNISAEIHDPDAPQTISPGMADIRFDDVTFTYPARPGRVVLDHLSLHIPAGKTVALVGVSGVGKSTIFQLLLRFYDPESGRISINGTEINAASLEALRGRIGLVPQDPVIFSGTIGENIRMGAKDATDEQVTAAATAASAMEFIARLPKGLDTQVGEKGVQLSGGQKQRIALARAIVRNPDILLLDEATSALDAENERFIQLALAEVTKGRTTVIIAHRLSTVMHADQIFLLNDGRVEATGTHTQLLAASPLYARLAKLQLSAA
jgi:ATP-binding cassette subfamily B protein